MTQHEQSPWKDFDAAWAEQASDAPRIKAFGREFTLPKSPPVKLLLIIMRARDGGDDATFSDRQVADMFGLLLGRETANALIDEGVSIEQMEQIITWAQQLYEQQSGGDGDPPVTGGPDEPSSPTGPPSKPTSPASTDWI